MMQLRFTDNVGDVTIGVLTMIGFMAMIAYVTYKLRMYNKML